MRKIQQAKTFQRATKKLHTNDKKALERVIKQVAVAPEKGDPKKGDLLGAYTKTFNLHGAQHRLMYSFDNEVIILLRFGPREIFYE